MINQLGKYCDIKSFALYFWIAWNIVKYDKYKY